VFFILLEFSLLIGLGVRVEDPGDKLFDRRFAAGVELLTPGRGPPVFVGPGPGGF
jgi:hypothetical protein